MDALERESVWRELETGGQNGAALIARLRFLGENPVSADLGRLSPWVASPDWQIASVAVLILSRLVSSGACSLTQVFESIPEAGIAKVGQLLVQDGNLSTSDFVELIDSKSRPARLGALAAISACNTTSERGVLDRLCQAVSSPDEHESALAAIALSRQADRRPSTRSLLIAQLNRPQPAPRHLCVLALLELAPPQWEELPILSAALHDAPPDLWVALQTIMDEYALPIEDLLTPPISEGPRPDLPMGLH